MKVVWTKQMDDWLMDLLKEPENSYKEIAKELSVVFGFEFTKNSCIGRARRLKMPPRPPRMMSRIKPSEPIVPKTPHRKKGEPITIYELHDGVCHWPLAAVEDYPPFVYCGKPAVDLGCSWCQTHANIAFGKPVTSGNAKISRPQW